MAVPDDARRWAFRGFEKGNTMPSYEKDKGLEAYFLIQNGVKALDMNPYNSRAAAVLLKEWAKGLNGKHATLVRGISDSLMKHSEIKL
jgi:hypothetical protein